MPNVIEPGMVVSHYQIIGRLGAGGMGEVYKAFDTVLGRTVALKILPPDLVLNDERTRRFVQEARSASSLNHPGIVTIYDVGEAPLVAAAGASLSTGGPIHYIAMELVEGVTLKHKIHDEPASLRTLLTYLTQAAEGLAKAHAAGIVHRDLKPENIMVSADGFAKVLDFGLAKLTRPQAASDGHTRTMALADATGEGVILGTVAYMSPEQVQGKPADHRSDIFAIGTILYEAATRRRPFVADSDVEVMHKILHDKPVAVTDLNTDVPVELRRIIRRCLAKEPERRFQSMKDVAIELSEIAEEFDQLSAASSTSGSGSAAVAAPPPAPSRWRTPFLGTAATVVAAAVLFGAYRWREAAVAPPGPVAFESMKIQALTSSGRADAAPAISPDGKYVAYITRDESGYAGWMRQVATGTDLRIVPVQSTPLGGLTFSPDSNYLYYMSGGTDSGNIYYSWLFAIPTMGGQSRKVIFDVDTPITFSPDGSQISFGRGVPGERQNDVIVAAADGSGARKVATFPRRDNAARVVWSPDGSKIITPALDPSAGWDFALMEIDVASGSTRRIGKTRRSSISDLHFLQGGSGLLIAATQGDAARKQLWLQPYPEGTPLRVTNDLSDYDWLTATRDASVVAALRTDTRTSLTLTGVDDSRPALPLAPGAAGVMRGVAVSRSGTIVYAIVTGNRADIAVLDTPQSAPRVVTRAGENLGPAISADGRTIVFSSANGDAPAHIFAIDADGSNRRQLTRGSGEAGAALSADGITLAYYSVANDGEIWVQSLNGGEPRKLSARGDGNSGLAVSPDGGYVAFLEWQSSERAASNLKVVPVAGGAPVLNLRWTTGTQIRWYPDGKTLTVRRGDDRGVHNIFSIPLSGGELKQFTKFASGRFASYDWTRDGNLVLVRTQSTSDVVLISDWLRAPKR